MRNASLIEAAHNALQNVAGIQRSGGGSADEPKA
jgi:hypothetical protein